MDNALKHFLEIPYERLEELNLEAKEKIKQHVPETALSEEYMKYLYDTRLIKAVTVGFSDIEGRFHMLDYDKKYLLRCADNLTFDGSSIKGFSDVRESDLRLKLDWSSFRWLPSDIFGPGKVLVFSHVCTHDGQPYQSDMRYWLKQFTETGYQKNGYQTNIAVECEGFLFKGASVEQTYTEHEGFHFVSNGGYFNVLPNDPLRLFIDRVAEAQRAMGFENEKDHPEVAPSQFELNYKYCDAVVAADLVQLYKLIARQVASNMGFTASFLPKPVAGINGSGMHVNVSVSAGGVNLFYEPHNPDHLSALARQFIGHLLQKAKELCLVFNSSVNAYRRLDPRFEAPNRIVCSPIDRTAMIRIPVGNADSARIEVRSVAADANPYLTFLMILKTGLEYVSENLSLTDATAADFGTLPDNIYEAIHMFENSSWMQSVIGPENVKKFATCKINTAHRCPREMGKIVKTAEVRFHHDVVNQYLWSQF